MSEAVSAIIVDYFTRSSTLKLAADLRLQECIVEILIVDNTGDVQYQSGWPTSLVNTRVIMSPRAAGYGEGVNLGAGNISNSAHLLILNSDLRIKSGSVGALLDVMNRRGLGAIGPLILDGTGHPQVAAHGSFPDVHTRDHDFDWITGACILIRTDIFARVDGFDECYFMYWEDIDLCRQLYAEGIPLGLDSALTVEHRSGGSVASSARRYAAARVSRGRYLEKWGVGKGRRLILRGTSLIKLYYLKGCGK